MTQDISDIYKKNLVLLKIFFNIATSERGRVPGLYLWWVWDLPPPFSRPRLWIVYFGIFKSFRLFSYCSDQFSSICVIFSGYKHEPSELFYRGGLGARELSDQLHEDGGNRRAHWEDQVRPGGPEIRLPAGDRGTEKAWPWQGTFLSSQLGSFWNNKSLIQVGAWSDITGVNFNRNFTETYSEIVESLQNKTLVVTTIMVGQVNSGQLRSGQYEVSVWPGSSSST